ncbi:hypothetical protein VTK26DRAFT_3422 [Humicola hyalothermophila]
MAATQSPLESSDCCSGFDHNHGSKLNSAQTLSPRNLDDDDARDSDVRQIAVTFWVC